MRCQECQERYVGCHSVCEYYREYKARREELRHKRYLDTQARSILIDSAIRRKKKTNRR